MGEVTEWRSRVREGAGSPNTLSRGLVRQHNPQPSRIDNNLIGWTTEEEFQLVQNVSPQDAFRADEVRLQPAWVILSVKLNPDLECQRCRGATARSTDQALNA